MLKWKHKSHIHEYFHLVLDCKKPLEDHTPLDIPFLFLVNSPTFLNDQISNVEKGKQLEGKELFKVKEGQREGTYAW